MKLTEIWGFSLWKLWLHFPYMDNQFSQTHLSNDLTVMLTEIPVTSPHLCDSAAGLCVPVPVVYPGPEAMQSALTLGKTRPLTLLVSDTISALWPFSFRRALSVICWSSPGWHWAPRWENWRWLWWGPNTRDGSVPAGALMPLRILRWSPARSQNAFWRVCSLPCSFMYTGLVVFWTLLIHLTFTRAVSWISSVEKCT